LIGRQPDGVQALVRLRGDLIKLLPEMSWLKIISFFIIRQNKYLDSPAYAKRMNDNLRDLLAIWFTTGLLEVERVTWQSPCEIGEI
jgi:hypothetical protein